MNQFMPDLSNYRQQHEKFQHQSYYRLISEIQNNIFRHFHISYESDLCMEILATYFSKMHDTVIIKGCPFLDLDKISYALNNNTRRVIILNCFLISPDRLEKLHWILIKKSMRQILWGGYQLIMLGNKSKAPSHIGLRPNSDFLEDLHTDDSFIWEDSNFIKKSIGDKLIPTQYNKFMQALSMGVLTDEDVNKFNDRVIISDKPKPSQFQLVSDPFQIKKLTNEQFEKNEEFLFEFIPSTDAEVSYLFNCENTDLVQSKVDAKVRHLKIGSRVRVFDYDHPINESMIRYGKVIECMDDESATVQFDSGETQEVCFSKCIESFALHEDELNLELELTHLPVDNCIGGTYLALAGRKIKELYIHLSDTPYQRRSLYGALSCLTNYKKISMNRPLELKDITDESKSYPL